MNCEHCKTPMYVARRWEYIGGPERDRGRVVVREYKCGTCTNIVENHMREDESMQQELTL